MRISAPDELPNLLGSSDNERVQMNAAPSPAKVVMPAAPAASLPPLSVGGPTEASTSPTVRGGPSPTQMRVPMEPAGHFEVPEPRSMMTMEENRERVNTTLFHDLGRTLPPHMRTGNQAGINWDQYVSVRRRGMPGNAWSEESGAQQSRVQPLSQRTAQPPMFPQLVPKPAGHIQSLLDDVASRDAQSMSSLMRAIRDAAAAHGRNAEVAHERALINPKYARREVEEALQREETHAATGGLKKHRKLRVASDIADLQILKARPPKGKKKRGGPRRPPAPDGYDGPLAADGGAGATAAHSAIASDGVSMMYAPALQPMPRFMGAGPVANGNLLRSRAPKAESDKWTAVGTV